MREAYKTGQVAKELNTSSHVIRRLCESGLIDSEVTASGQWRIPLSELARLKREGLPAVPQPQGEDGAIDGNPPKPKPSSPLLASPSDEAVSSAESVLIAQNKVAKRRLDKELEETEDFFRERQRREQAEEEAASARQAKLETEKARQQWLSKWIDYGLGAIPQGVPQECRLDVHEAVEAMLQNLPVGYSETALKALIASTTEKAISPWRKEQQRQSAIQMVDDRLPYGAKNAYQLTVWQIKARQTAAARIRQLGENASSEEMKAVAAQVGKQICQEYEHQELCHRLMKRTALSSWNSTLEEREQSQEDVANAVAALPIGATERQIEKACETATAPYREAIAARENEARHKQICGDLLSTISSDMGWEATSEYVQRAKAQAKKALEASPIETTWDQLRQIKEKALEPIKAEIAERKAKQERRKRAEIQAARYLPHVDTYLRHLQKHEEYVFDNRWRLARELEEDLRPLLIDELLIDPEMDQDEAQAFIENFIHDEVD